MRIPRAGLHLFLALCAGIVLPGVAMAQNVPGCGSLANAFGPHDYRDPKARGEPLYLVEMAHFTPEVESLTAGKTGEVIGDLDYTLRAFPNHHRALSAVSRYGQRGKVRWINPYVQSADCYFERAVAFAPDDERVRLLYGNHLARKGEKDKAERQYQAALDLAPENVDVCYNAALFFLDIGKVERARELAQVAYSAGYPLDGLRRRLEALDKQPASR